MPAPPLPSAPRSPAPARPPASWSGASASAPRPSASGASAAPRTASTVRPGRIGCPGRPPRRKGPWSARCAGRPTSPSTTSPSWSPTSCRTSTATASGASSGPRGWAGVLGITTYSHVQLEQLLRGFNAAYNARRQRVLDGKTPDQVVAERLKARRELANPKPQGRAGPDDIAKARRIAEAAKDVSPPDNSLTVSFYAGHPTCRAWRGLWRG